VLGASFDDVPANRAFAEKFQFPFKLLCDTEKAIGQAYDALDPAEPGYAKRISYLIGPDRRIVKTYGTVKPATHPQEVLGDLP
jgi:peroxiredoxin Q/BCP